MEKHRPFAAPSLGRRMFGDIEMNDTAMVVAKDDEDEQNSEGCGRQSEKVVDITGPRL